MGDGPSLETVALTMTEYGGLLWTGWCSQSAFYGPAWCLSVSPSIWGLGAGNPIGQEGLAGSES